MNERERKITGKNTGSKPSPKLFSDDKQSLKVKVEISHSIFVIMIMIISMMSRKAQN